MKSAIRVLEILEYFDGVRGAASIVSIARALDYPQSSTSALLRSMVALGYLQYDAIERTYFPTDRVPLLGNWVNPQLYREGKILSLMEHLNQATGALVVLAARNGDFAQYIHVVDAQDPKNLSARIGQLCPIAASGTGWALLAEQRDEDIRKLLHWINAQATKSEEIVRFDELSKSLSEARQKGYAISFDRVVTGFGMLATVLPRTGTQRPLVLGLGLPSHALRMREHQIAMLLSEQVSAHLGRPIQIGAGAAASRTASAGATYHQARCAPSNPSTQDASRRIASLRPSRPLLPQQTHSCEMRIAHWPRR